MSQNITIIEAVKKCLNKYADFNGRAPRAEYWYFFLFNFIVAVVINILIAATDGSKIFMILSYIYSLAMLIPGIAVGFRRMHDIGKSGLWLLINFVPLIGSIWFIILAIKPSQPGDNEFGPNPYE